jgi:hypothetical protein
MAFKLPYGLSASLHAGLQPLKVVALEGQAARCLWPRQVGLRLPIVGGSSGHARGSVIVVHKAAATIRRIAADRDWIQSRNGFSTAWRRLRAMLDIIAADGVPDGDWPADLSDHATTNAPVLAFSSFHPAPILVPDRGFMSSGGYAREWRRAAAAPAFTDRDPTIVWRGSPSGLGKLVNEPLAASDRTLRQRVRLCLALRDLAAAPDAWGDAADVDAKIVLWGGAAPEVTAAYRIAGILGPAIPQRSWCHRRFAIDIDGNSNAFSNLFIRLLYGCCVIKVASPLGFRQWYYDRLEPWVHYVPVAANLSDLAETIAWCQGHPRDCRDIAAAGQRIVMGMTVESERRAVVAEIDRRQAIPWVARAA